MVEPVELQPIESKPSSRDDKTGYSSSAASCSNPGYTHSSNCSNPGYTHSSKSSRSGTKSSTNGKTDVTNYKYASAFQSTTPPQWTDDTYDNTGDETKHHFDGAYNHIPTHFGEEYVATHLSIHTRLNASETYDHVILCTDDVYEDTCVAQDSTIQYKSYDVMTKGTCETPASKPYIINNQGNIMNL
ncbi:hypothetical protein ACJMK2_021273 [Sinanodonta woodiana]|uniref:Uncharacterized protein n=1 Tax=Sinanodonta woodiana TaxID=1069815 RepID=A0ABD3TFL0_SINWO